MGLSNGMGFVIKKFAAKDGSKIVKKEAEKPIEKTLVKYMSSPLVNTAGKVTERAENPLSTYLASVGVTRSYLENPKEAALQKEIKRIQTSWCKQNGINPERMGSIEIDKNDRLKLPAQTIGGNLTLNNKIYLNKETAAKESLRSQLTNTIPHECTHNHLENLRSAYRVQNPEEFESRIKQNIFKSIENNDNGEIFWKRKPNEKAPLGFDNLVTKVPDLSKEERKQVSNYVAKMLDTQEGLVSRNNLIVELTDKSKADIKANLMPHLKGKDETEVEKYIEAQINRYDVQKEYCGSLAKCPGIDKTLTPQEKRLAEKTTDNIINICDRTLSALNDIGNPDALVGYCTDLEETLARKSATKFQIKEINNEITQLKKVNPNFETSQKYETLLSKKRNNLNELRVHVKRDKYRELTAAYNNATTQAEKDQLAPKIEQLKKEILSAEAMKTFSAMMKDAQMSKSSISLDYLIAGK